MSLSREQICQQAARKLLAAAPNMRSIKATIGLDGFVDEIIAVVDKRHDCERFDPIREIEVFGQKVLASAGQSNNFELVVKQMKLGGNGPIMANALAATGMGITYLGCLGFPEIHPVFAQLAQRSERVITVADPGHTDALEFEDGKLMLGKHGSLRDVTWANLLLRVGLDTLIGTMSDSTLIGMVNWTMLPYLSEIWAKLSDEVFPKLPKAKRYFFADLCDPEKRTADDLRAAMKLLTKIQGQMDVILGLNLKESTQVARVLGVAVPESAKDQTAAIEKTARGIREALDLSCVVVHPRRGAAAATDDGAGAEFVGPFVKDPKISTGAGDHFNAGFCLGRVLGMSLEESLATGCGTSGYYVRTALSPSAQQLAEFIATMPGPQ
ncbi:MAG TPA: PfkB family carbohydrate kinase [Tepidisphaeraceae bacterium]|jgi:sugar/nucleoside kinase (ribokinase family)|nr:PfkB family carbohydrate kinase [Tepidisphaeraceae bacterium]